jgi:hypothetical protein
MQSARVLNWLIRKTMNFLRSNHFGVQMRENSPSTFRTEIEGEI